MPDPLEYGDVMRQVRMLKDSTDMQAHRRYRGVYLRTLGMEEPAPLPGDIAKGNIMESRSPKGMLIKRQIKAEVAGYPTYTTVTAWNPDGNLNAALKAQADKVERWLTLKNEELMPGLKSATYDHELASGYAVWGLHCDDAHKDGEENPDIWSLEVFNPDTCYFPIQLAGAYVPKVLAREYSMLVEDAKAKYPDADWNRLSIGRPVHGGNESTQGFGGAVGKPEEVTFTALYTRDYSYHCLTGTENNGEVVWQEPNHTGGKVPCVVVVGDLNESGGDGKKHIPIMLALLQVLANRNLINALRATVGVSREMPDVLLETNPTALAAAGLNGTTMAVAPASMEELPTTGAKLIKLDGKPTVYVPAPNEDLDKLDQRWAEEEAACVQALTLTADASIAAASTAEAYWIVNGVQNRQLTPMLQHLDEGLALIDDMILNSIVDYGLKGGHPIYSTKETKRENATRIARGEGVVLEAKDVEDFNCRVYVNTKQETEEQRERRGAQVWVMYTQGRISWQQVIASDVSDVVEQLQELNKDAAYKVASNTLAPYLATMLNLSALTRAGVNLAIMPTNVAGAGMATPPSTNGGGSNWEPRTAPAAAGGSAADGSVVGQQGAPVAGGVM